MSHEVHVHDQTFELPDDVMTWKSWVKVETAILTSLLTAGWLLYQLHAGSTHAHSLPVREFDRALQSLEKRLDRIESKLDDLSGSSNNDNNDNNHRQGVP